MIARQGERVLGLLLALHHSGVAGSPLKTSIQSFIIKLFPRLEAVLETILIFLFFN